jgi:acetyl esterase
MKLDPDAQALLDAAIKAGRPAVETLTPEAARKMMREIRAALKQPQPVVAEARDLSIPGPHGAIPARLYRAHAPKAAEAQPVLIYYHGGGWVFGDIETHDNLCRSLANIADCTVISVDYRLAPESKFPKAVDDAWAAVKWAADNAAALSLDADRIAVGGDSAGGNLAAVVSQMAVREGSPKLSYQILFYPTVDLSLSHESFKRAGTGFNLTLAAMAWFRDLYLNDHTEIADWRASPLRAADLKGVPPAYVTTAGCDPLCDEGDAYVRLLEQHGVPVKYRHFPGQMHGFAAMSGFVAAADHALADVGAELKRVWNAA